MNMFVIVHEMCIESTHKYHKTNAGLSNTCSPLDKWRNVYKNLLYYIINGILLKLIKCNSTCEIDYITIMRTLQFSILKFKALS